MILPGTPPKNAMTLSSPVRNAVMAVVNTPVAHVSTLLARLATALMIFAGSVIQNEVKLAVAVRLTRFAKNAWILPAMVENHRATSVNSGPNFENQPMIWLIALPPEMNWTITAAIGAMRSMSGATNFSSHVIMPDSSMRMGEITGASTWMM